MQIHSHKKRVGRMVQEKLHLTKDHTTPEELSQLKKNFENFSKQLHHLLELLKDQRATTMKSNEAKVKVARHLATMTAETPLEDTLGNVNNMKSFKAVQNELKISGNKAEEKFAVEIVNKVALWEMTVNHRVKQMEEYCDGLRRDLEHYEKKVENLHSGIQEDEKKKGKEVKSSAIEKANRNDEKLEAARAEYTTSTQEFGLYLAQVTENRWRDLAPLAHLLATWDMSTAEEQSNILSGLKEVLSQLEEIGEQHGFDATADRIEKLKHDKSEKLEPSITVTWPSTPPTTPEEAKNKATPQTQKTASSSPGGNETPNTE